MVFLAMAGKDGPFVNVQGPVQVIVGVCGSLICFGWFVDMGSFRSLFEAKLETLRAIEKKLPFELFTKEKEKLGTRHYVHVTVIDQIIPAACLVLFGFLLFYKQR